MSQRIEKINDLIRDHLSEIFQKEISFKSGLLVTISKVETSSDLSQSRVFVSVYPKSEENYALKTLENERKKIKKKLYGKMKTRIFPKIRFEIDEKQEKISQIEEVFREIEKERQ